MAKHPSSGKYAIVGLGVVAGPQPDKSERMMGAEAARLAIEDAGLTRKDIGGAIDLRRSGGGGDRGSYTDAFTRVLGLNNNFYFVTGRGGALAGLGIACAISFIERGIADGRDEPVPSTIEDPAVLDALRPVLRPPTVLATTDAEQ